MIYGNIYYYQNEDEFSYSFEDCENLGLCMFLLILFGYYEMLKCCCVGTCVLLMIPILMDARRRAERPDWVPTPANFLQ